jgi:hypothetical protein
MVANDLQKLKAEIAAEIGEHLDRYEDAGKWLDNYCSEDERKTSLQACLSDALHYWLKKYEGYESLASEDGRCILLISLLLLEPDSKIVAGILTKFAQLPWITEDDIDSRAWAGIPLQLGGYADRWEKLIRSALEQVRLQEQIEVARATGLIPKVRDKILEFNLVDNRRIMKHIDKTLSEHLQDFEAALLAKGNGKKYAKQVASRVELIFTDCGFRTMGDIDANALYTYLSDMRKNGLGQRSFNYYLKNCKQFCKWMIKEQRATAPSPLEHLSCIKQTEKRRQRRAITVDEVRNLLTTTQTAPERYGLTGTDRALLYRLAIESVRATFSDEVVV